MRRDGLKVKSNYSRVSCHEYDFDRRKQLGLALDTYPFVADVACADARFLWYYSLSLSSIDRANFARVRQLLA